MTYRTLLLFCAYLPSIHSPPTLLWHHEGSLIEQQLSKIDRNRNTNMEWSYAADIPMGHAEAFEIRRLGQRA